LFIDQSTWPDEFSHTLKPSTSELLAYSFILKSARKRIRQMMIIELRITRIHAIVDFLFFHSEIKAVIAVMIIKAMNKFTVGIPSK